MIIVILFPPENEIAIIAGAIVGSIVFVVVLIIPVLIITVFSVRRARRHRQLMRINACIIATTGPSSVTVATISNISSSQDAPLLANEQPPPTTEVPAATPHTPSPS